MNQPALDEHVGRTHAVLSYLFAAYQGKFAAQNCLAQLQSEQFSSEELEKTKAALQKIHNWLSRLWTGDVLLNAYWTKPETFDAREIVELLQGLERDLFSSAQKLESLIAENDFEENHEHLKQIVATYARYVYASDNYLRQHIDFEKRYQNEEGATGYEELLADVRLEVDFVSQVIQTAKKPSTAEKGFFPTLRQTILTVPGSFRTQVHDIQQLLSPYTGELTFEKIGIPPDDAADWQELEVSPIEAGYWHAMGLTAREALHWSQVGLYDHDLAARWQSWGFDPNSAAPWFHAGFNTIKAILWASHGFTPQEAQDWLKRGVDHPQDVPEDPIV